MDLTDGSVGNDDIAIMIQAGLSQ
ncbi:hypothetical protein VIBNISOn1_900051 [Vibrio nigripulchritudo SOn1]|uniref:Uncharacterized protein n=1 Tax=Vibrio nigripulchritudo SOn1 TaxID=1238450 RepID=A0AAV2VZ20_9VIBR|nr:hypothetical protein VIBNISOn1_900051 [Vibrio nigripulchritudo SOn1]